MAPPAEDQQRNANHARRAPLLNSRVRHTANAVSPAVVVSNQIRRSSRSAITPPNGESSPIGRNAAAATRPVQPGRPVRAVTKTPTATVCIHEPTLED